MLRTFIKIFIITLIIMAAGAIIIEGMKSSRREILAEKKTEYTAVKGQVSPMEKIKEERAGFFVRLFFLDYPVRMSYSVSDFIRKLGLRPTPSLKLTGLQISADIEKFSFSMTGRIRSFSEKGAYPKFLRFFSYLNGFDNMLFLSHSDLEPVKEKAVERIQDEFRFTISGEVETE